MTYCGSSQSFNTWNDFHLGCSFDVVGFRCMLKLHANWRVADGLSSLGVRSCTRICTVRLCVNVEFCSSVSNLAKNDYNINYYFYGGLCTDCSSLFHGSST